MTNFLSHFEIKANGCVGNSSAVLTVSSTVALCFDDIYFITFLWLILFRLLNDSSQVLDVVNSKFWNFGTIAVKF